MKKLDEKELRELYVDKRYTYAQLMEHFGCYKQIVIDNLHTYHITRPKGNPEYYIGKKFDNFKVLSIKEFVNSNVVYYNCQCNCGETFIVQRCNIQAKKSCKKCSSKKGKPGKARINKVCKQCGEIFHKSVWINGKNYRSEDRNYCIKCRPIWKAKELKEYQQKLALENKKLCRSCLRIKDINNFSSYSLCKHCRSYTAFKKGRSDKQKLVDYKGGKCERCGYDKCTSAFDFHHKDPTQKEFALAKRKPLAVMKREVDKCELLCANCHREHHHNLSEEKYSDISNEPIATDLPRRYVA